MGFSTIIDILGSIIIGGLLLLVLMNMRRNASETNSEFQGDQIMQTNLTNVTEILHFYLDRIGFVDNPSTARMGGSFVSEARDTSFSFQGDVNEDGTMDQVSISLGNLVTSTPNPSDRNLIIRINGNTQTYNVGLANLNFEFYDFAGDRLSAPLSETDRAAIFTYTVNISMLDIYQMPDKYNPQKVFTKTIDSRRRNLRGNFTR